MSPLRQKQLEFPHMLVKLWEFIWASGYSFRLGDAYRDPRAFGEIGKVIAYGHPKSGHKQRLAIDLILEKDGVMLTETKDHEPFGVYWESLGGTWGGRFKDGNHYSLEFNGIK